MTRGIGLMYKYNVRMSETLRAGGEEAQTLYFRLQEPKFFDHFDHLTHNHIKFP